MEKIYLEYLNTNLLFYYYMIQYNEEYNKSLPKNETIEEYYTKNGLVYNEVKARKLEKENDMDIEAYFYRQIRYYVQ